jgi:uncharacterized Zn finger protein
LVELLQGRFSKGTMERMCRQKQGLFPTPKEISFACDCPDYASMCKHIAAVLYGVGARLDERPELLFRLRAVDETELLPDLAAALPLSATAPDEGKVLADDDLSALFGLDMDAGETEAVAKPKRTAAGKTEARSTAKGRAASATKSVPPVAVKTGGPAVATAKSRPKAAPKARMVGKAVRSSAAALRDRKALAAVVPAAIPKPSRPKSPPIEAMPPKAKSLARGADAGARR